MTRREQRTRIICFLIMVALIILTPFLLDAHEAPHPIPTNYQLPTLPNGEQP